MEPTNSCWRAGPRASTSALSAAIKLRPIVLLFALCACSGGSNDSLGTGGDEEQDAGEGSGGGGGGDGQEGEDLVTLTLSVDGDSSVQFFTNGGERILCGQTASGRESPCVAQFVRGSEVDIQRTLSLPREEEARFRLSAYGDDCATVDTDTEPRGGHCRLTMDRDHDVSVRFERRAQLTVTHTSPDNMINFRWSLAYSMQKAGGNPLTQQGTFDCYLPGMPCEKGGTYDVGTVITVRAGNGTDAPTLKSWGGACAMAGSNPTCMFTLTGDSTVTGNWSYF